MVILPLTLDLVIKIDYIDEVAWGVEFYVDGEGREPVAEYLDSLDTRARAKVAAAIAKLAALGPTLPFPCSSQVAGKLRELRTQLGKDRLRILYFGAPGRKFILLHGFTKRTEKIPEADRRIALERMQAYLKSKRGK